MEEQEGQHHSAASNTKMMHKLMNAKADAMKWAAKVKEVGMET